MQRYDFYLSCASVWREKLCKAREKSINLFICFSEPQPILCKSEDLTGVFNSCWVLERALNCDTNCHHKDNSLGNGWYIVVNPLGVCYSQFGVKVLVFCSIMQHMPHYYEQLPCHGHYGLHLVIQSFSTLISLF